MHGTIYKITNTVDKLIYIGSTTDKLCRRMAGHRSDARKNNAKPVSQHMRNLGVDKFKIELVRSVIVSSRKELRIVEQVEIDKYNPSELLNVLLAYSYNRDKTRDQEKKRKVRRDYYYKHMKDPEWHEKEKLRQKLKMREVRGKEKFYRETFKELCRIEI